MHARQVKDVQSMVRSCLLYISPIFTKQNSNLTFGAGGKDKNGLVTTGWGYYEVHLKLRLHYVFLVD